MTMWGKFVRSRELVGVQYERLPSSDGDEITLASSARNDGPILLLLHGLEGSMRSHYVPGIWTVAHHHGWQPMVLLFRTCDGHMNQARRTYHSGETTDLDAVVRLLVERFPGRPMGLVGVSLGGNVLLKWLGERGDNVPPQVRAAMAVSTPYDLGASSKAIDSGFAKLYQWNFLRSLKQKARGKLSQFPDVCARESLDSVRTMWEFDDRFTAPLHGFADARDYYNRCSSIRFIDRIRRPTLLLSAHDDPFYSAKVLDEVRAVAAKNPSLELEFHSHGGHVGFVGGSPWQPTYYVETRAGTFLSPHLGQV